MTDYSSCVFQHQKLAVQWKKNWRALRASAFWLFCFVCFSFFLFTVLISLFLPLKVYLLNFFINLGSVANLQSLQLMSCCCETSRWALSCPLSDQNESNSMARIGVRQWIYPLFLSCAVSRQDAAEGLAAVNLGKLPANGEERGKGWFNVVARLLPFPCKTKTIWGFDRVSDHQEVMEFWMVLWEDLDWWF